MALLDSLANITPFVGPIKAFVDGETNSLDVASSGAFTGAVTAGYFADSANAASNARFQQLQRLDRNRAERIQLQQSIQANNSLVKVLKVVGKWLGVLGVGIEAINFQDAVEKCECKP